MKKNSLLKFIFGIILLFSFNLNAELIFEDNFPKDMHGIWSDDCDSEYQVFIISNNTSMWICLLYTSPSPRDLSTSRMPSSA